MLPLQLTLHNFISYGEPEEILDFRALGLACISGNNGEGKSALLDAITWALWGIARGTDQRGASGDDLIRLGADEARVAFEFEVNGAAWRVERTRKRGKSSGLNLQHWAESGWKDSSGATLRASQDFLNKLLGLDYQTFINSAFLLQGRADEFCRQNAGKRKEILADVLGLNIFDELSKRARERSREAQTKADLLEYEVKHLEEEIAKEAELEQSVKETEALLAQAKSKLQNAREEAGHWQQQVARLEAQQQQAGELEQRARKSTEQLKGLQKERETAANKLAEWELLLQKSQEIERGFARLLAGRKAEQEWGDKAARSIDLSRQREAHTLVIEREKAALNARAKSLKEHAAALAARAKADKIISEADFCKQEIASLEARQKEAAALQENLQILREKIAQITEKNRQLQVFLEEKNESLDLLGRAEAVCPVCKGQLSETRRRELIAETEQEIAAAKLESEAGRKAIAQAKAAAEKQETEIRKLQTEGARLTQLKQKLGQFETMLLQAQESKAQLEIIQQDLAKTEQTLAEDRFAAEARNALAAVDAGIAALGYDAQAHRLSAEQTRKLLPFEAGKRNLEQAGGMAGAFRETLEKLEVRIASESAEINSLQENLQRLQKETAALPQAKQQQAALHDAVQKAESETNALERQAAVAKSRLERIAEDKNLLATRKNEKETALEESVIHSDLAVAFGKNGVQALVIETALPQLEQHANELLDRLSEGRMRVSFQTQRERGGEMSETLEIRIRDQNGERRYEMYSGGEAFRLNFAIRLALSKLLTQRAGAKLSTLVIDEGFGSQDTEGRQRLVEAIQTVADDFERILVITHLDELKGEFPQRIEITKDERGSHIRQIGL